MKTTLLTTLVMGMLSSGPDYAAERSVLPPSSRTTCNQQATAAQITGKARETYLQNCLRNRQSAPGEKSLTPRQQQMNKCRRQANQLDVDARRRAISECMAPFDG
ncbi:PsiF family protein [Franconibacter helveticus]|uniref:PsiF family protein n=1 Tax=Franconibacter helveticus TaxID=357240 RepID=UPI000DA196D8|nr:PsiF family protein [Franconibacter helveticus]